jgi:hypothetical protein
VRFLSDVENSPLPIEKTIRRLATWYDQLCVCFEAGPTGYGLYRQLKALGYEPSGCGYAGVLIRSPARFGVSAGATTKQSSRDEERKAVTNPG